MNTNHPWLSSIKTNHMALEVKFGDKEFAFKKGATPQPTQSIVVVTPPAETKKGDILTPLSATASIIASIIAILLGVRHFMKKRAIRGLTA
jgi:hypothetical protein